MKLVHGSWNHSFQILAMENEMHWWDITKSDNYYHIHGKNKHNIIFMDIFSPVTEYG